MAPPPQHLCAHDGAALHFAKVAQPGKTAVEAVAHCVVGIVVKTFILPERVHAQRNIVLLATQTAELCNVAISDMVCRQCFG